mgnify:CR=1 FL=1
MIGTAISTASLRLAVYVTVRLLSIIGTVGPFVKAFFRFFYGSHAKCPGRTRGTRSLLMRNLLQAFCSAAKRNRIVASSARVAPAFGASSAALRPLTRPSATAHAMASCANALTASASP